MLTWIILILLVLVPLLAPSIERACSTYAGFVRPDAAMNGSEQAVENMRTPGHLRRAKAEGARWMTTARAEGRSFDAQMREIRKITSR